MINWVIYTELSSSKGETQPSVTTPPMVGLMFSPPLAVTFSSLHQWVFLSSFWIEIPSFSCSKTVKLRQESNHSKQRVKSKWLNFGDGFATKSDRLTIWHQTPQPMWKRKVKCRMSVIPRLYNEMRVETGDLKTQRSLSSRAENTR